jgi:hypothetical protein
VIRTLDPELDLDPDLDPYLQLENMLNQDPDPHLINADPKPLQNI